MGKVYIVGAGPGDPELITLKAFKVLREADVIVYADSLVNPEILKYAKEGCEIYGSSGMDLKEIVELMAAKTKEGKTVVRLKSGDPTIYGALLEEINELERLGIDYEIIPGVTAMTAAASVLKTSLTVPERLQSIVVLRPSCRAPIDADTVKLLQAARDGSTLAIYLGTSCIHRLVETLLYAGYSRETQVAVVYRATWSDQKVFICRLGDLGDVLDRNNISGGYIVLIGPPIDTHSKFRQPRSVVYSKYGTEP